jgi:beta-lactamase class D
MLVENTPTYTLRAKTGWAARPTQKIGWYVGYVETDEDVWFFATNLDIGNNANLPLRQELTRQALQGAGILH